ncbi:MAG: quinolinate synthase NadA [Cytophagaceae bacterium]
MIDFGLEINRIKREKNAVILAHYYQRPEVQEVADFIGDSLNLAYKANETPADIIVFAGVLFMAETAKIICPGKKVLVPDFEAGCSLSDNCTAVQFKKFIDRYPDHTVVSYINCSAEVKAMSDVICTSSNAVKIVESLPADRPIIFAPDKNLGRYVKEVSGRDLVLWDGSCFIHESFSEVKILDLKKKHPDAEIIAHPECAEIVIMIADHIGSTAQLIRYAKQSSKKEFIVVTEAGILHEMQKEMPEKILIPAPPSYYTSCNCGECPYMKLTTLEKIYSCLVNETPEIFVPDQVQGPAMRAIEKMFELTEK